jgi:hypothetical protein
VTGPDQRPSGCFSWRAPTIQGYGLAARIVLADRSATLGSSKIGQIVEKLARALDVKPDALSGAF